jgi:hypothetical protein
VADQTSPSHTSDQASPSQASPGRTRDARAGREPRPVAALPWTSDGAVLATVVVTGAVFVGFAVLVAFVVWRGGGDYPSLFRDPAAHYKFPVEAGVFGTLGAAMLFATAGATAVAALCGRALATPFGVVAAMSALLAIDDLFMLHEEVLPRNGIPEIVVLAVLGLGMLAVLALHLPQTSGARRVAFLVPYALLGTSAAADLLLPFSWLGVLFEDGLKFGGFAAWLVYWFTTAAGAVATTARRGGIE